MTTDGDGHEVVLEWRDGRRETVRVDEGTLILDACEAAGVALPFGCRTGACATCTALLREGSVDHCRPPRGLKERHRADGYVLTCVATPTEDCRLEVGADVQEDLVSNPWK
ncbi:2Fe-2S iron-sulfur cluster binding domain-containing protein [Halostella sp. JP-L12]|uniref:2Fe-2S iron-sulfur cluster-binding protein n=1 Tax=Halostella TaxID=1843185 RepID=UPI000EF81D4A|nr:MULTISPECIES: 2Fe-2S iron-sulfur cluster-binding protein [Halostella]NHN46646.1 2Fe-2S iron-sulfur cluster binding domain-containing protein [Halostella sp. JP-L12]